MTDLLQWEAFHPPLFYADAFLRLPCHGVAQRRRNPLIFFQTF